MALQYFSHLRALIVAFFTDKPLVWHSPAGHSFVINVRRGTVLPQIAGGAPEEGETDEGDKDKPQKAEPGKETDAGKEDDEDEEKVTKDDDWQTKSRKNENRAKRAEAAANEEREKREKLEEAGKSESEKAVEKARKEGETSAATAAAKERKADRLEVAVTRLASKKLKLGDGDDAEEVRFADAEDAHTYIDKALRSGDIDESEIFDDEGKVKTDALRQELADLLGRKPHLKESSEGATKKPGDGDTRKGDPVTNDLESLTPEQHAERKYGKSK